MTVKVKGQGPLRTGWYDPLCHFLKSDRKKNTNKHCWIKCYRKVLFTHQMSNKDQNIYVQ